MNAVKSEILKELAANVYNVSRNMLIGNSLGRIEPFKVFSGEELFSEP